MSSRVRIILVASLVLNIVFAGVILGHMSHRFLWSHAHHVPAELLARLPQDKRMLFEAAMKNEHAQMEALHAQMMDTRAEASRLLAAEPFNEDAYLTQMQHVADLQAQLKRHMSETVATLAKQFTPEERATLAEITSHPPDAEAKPHTPDDKH